MCQFKNDKKSFLVSNEIFFLFSSFSYTTLTFDMCVCMFVARHGISDNETIAIDANLYNCKCLLFIDDFCHIDTLNRLKSDFKIRCLTQNVFRWLSFLCRIFQREHENCYSSSRRESCINNINRNEND